MVANSYIRLILFSVFFFFNYKFIYVMENLAQEINIDKAFSLYKERSLLIIDVRTKKEWKMTGVIPNSILINMHDDNNLERESFVEEVKFELDSNKNKNIAFICASGSRSEAVMSFFSNKGYKNVFHIPNGIMGHQNDGWLFQGFPITNYHTKKETK